MTTQVELHPCSVGALPTKVRLYSERTNRSEVTSADYALESTICLEMLARVALASVSPMLLAENRDGRNLSYALDHPPTSKKSGPGSIGVKEVRSRLSELGPNATQEITNFCTAHFNKRNAELHSGELVFHGYGSSAWQPR
ncbi:hypothetical protein EVC45_03195 [Paraburkholderia sp. UYCP14C]|uniref:hypothetical protein n=1 Tax=Paraburkholderia sp. UYCP14C TaxID=2511130 RepID=UPI00101EB145|nr:hypothetical protein [Paraburkholderia sp. UYCP14C]RZF30972.1 hypothetical protein EVC45_03195 [Paraburkholderia sp. UYCP14C]